MSNEALENLLHEDRTFPPDTAFAASANATPALVEQAAADRIAFWEQQARRLRLGPALGHGPGLVGRAVREVVRRRAAQRRRELRGPPRGRRPR